MDTTKNNVNVADKFGEISDYIDQCSEYEQKFMLWYLLNRYNDNFEAKLKHNLHELQISAGKFDYEKCTNLIRENHTLKEQKNVFDTTITLLTYELW